MLRIRAMISACIAVAVLSAWVAKAEEAGPVLSDTETAMVSQLNAFRARQGRPALKPASWLMERARQHCRWMLSHGMIHSSGVAENIAMGQGSVTSVTNTWINSSGHRANMLSGNTHVGVAGYTSPSGTPYWVQQFGGPEGSPAAVEGSGGMGGSARSFVRRLFRRR